MRTSKPSSVIQLAFTDELEKIAEEEVNNKQRFKKWLKNTALIAAGTGLGTGIAMVGDKGLRAGLGPTWKTLDPRTRLAILSAGAALTSSGAAALHKKMEKEKLK